MAMNVIDVEYEEIDLGQVDGTNGTNGKELELQVASNYIQMRYTGGTWTNLLPLSLITGPQGLKGDAGKKLQLQADGTYIQYKYEGETAWTNLIALSVLKGPKGEDGADGKKLLIQVAGGYIQYRYEGDASWVNLISIASITGPEGKVGPTAFKVDTATQSIVSFKTARNASVTKTKGQLTDASGKALYPETSTEQIYADANTTQEQINKGEMHYISHVPGESITLGTYDEWVAAGKPVAPSNFD